MAEKLYDELAEWWHLMSAPAEYAEEAGFYRSLLDEACSPTDVLELGSGGGNNAFHMKHHYSLTLVDRSEAMLRMSREINPELPHVRGDMREVRLGRTFDAVFVHDAINYLRTPLDLATTLANVRAHCRDGGAALLTPDHMRDTFEEAVSEGGHDGGGRGLRYLEWTWDPDPADDTYRCDYAFLLREANGDVRVAHDVHILGLFSQELWTDACRDAGFEPEVRRLVHTDEGVVDVLLCRAV